MFKYFEIFKKTLSGTIGKNLINMEFPLDQEKEGGTQEFLMKLRGSKLQDNAILEEFYDKIIENYDYGENYYTDPCRLRYPGQILRRPGNV